MYLLFGLAIVDLVVGVSNDAVNFLNSAIGSKVAPFRTILIIASIGILVGAGFSSGMMEVARKGVFVPGFFTFENIMYVFLAVLLTDIILLDLYNSLGLPTSTTVSIVFELLGAAFVIGLLVSFNQEETSVNLSDFINFSSAFTIIVGIFLSILVSFTVGAAIQYFIRLAFTFDVEKQLQKFGGIFSGVAITSITYFLLIKGVKGSAFSNSLSWIQEYTLSVICISLLFWTIVAQLALKYTSFNPLKLIVLMGTFSLSMAFAGNDLVNFIGLAIAGKQAYFYWLEAGSDLSLKMTFLSEEQPTETILLFAAGAIMVVTLWFSSKAKKVTETEVNLSRQEEGDEQFKPNLISRALVGTTMAISKGISSVLPKSMQGRVDHRFSASYVRQNVDENDEPAFDLLRASVNLMLASILISYATSITIPLSTTYVSFMVAMGTSLSDKAWGRESAVYRVAGVLNVIGGWLLTAVIAFVASGLFGLILYYGKFPAVIGLTFVAGGLLVRSHISFSRKAKEEEETNELFAKAVDLENVIDESKINTAKNIDIIRKAVSLSLKSLVGQNKDILVNSSKQLERLNKQNLKLESKIIKYIRKMENGEVEAGRLYLTVFDLMQDLSSSASNLSGACTNHVINHHDIPSREYLSTIVELDSLLSSFFTRVMSAIDNLAFENFESIRKDRDKVLTFIHDEIDLQISMIQNQEVSSRNGLFQTRVLLESKTIVSTMLLILEAYVDYARKD